MERAQEAASCGSFVLSKAGPSGAKLSHGPVRIGFLDFLLWSFGDRLSLAGPGWVNGNTHPKAHHD